MTLAATWLMATVWPELAWEAFVLMYFSGQAIRPSDTGAQAAPN